MLDLTSINKTSRIVLITISSIVLFIVSYILFDQIEPLLISTKIFVFNIKELSANVTIPIILFVLLLLILTYSIVITKSLWIIVGIPLALILSQKFSIFSFISALGILFSLFMFYKSFLDDLDNFKRPSISRCINVSFGLPLTLFALSMLINFYPVYSNFINNESLSFDSNISNLIYEISSGVPSSQNGFDRDDTVRSFAIKTLHNQEQPITEKNIQTVEIQIAKQFGVELDENTKVIDLQAKLIESKLSDLIKSNKTQSLIVLLFTIFLIFETFVKISSWLAGFIIYLLEKLALIFKIKLISEDVN